MVADHPERPILVVGATGYVGGRLVPLLLSQGYRVRAMGRSIAKLNCRPWARHPNVETAQGDVQNTGSFERAADGCRAAFYLVHSMIAEKKRYARVDRAGALNMAAVPPTVWSESSILGDSATRMTLDSAPTCAPGMKWKPFWLPDRCR